jgi:hypothetical protein
MAGCEKNDRIHGRKTSVSLSGTRSMKLLQLKRFVSPNSFIEIIGGRRHANPSSAIGCLFSITIAASQPSDRRSMTLGNMREL